MIWRKQYNAIIQIINTYLKNDKKDIIKNIKNNDKKLYNIKL